jgi:hypothetical protein
MMGGTTLIMASTAVSRAGSAKPAEKAGPASSLDMSEVVRELAAVAAYIGHIKLEIAALRANELYRDRIPMAHRELGGIVRTTATATNTIMTAAEEILGSDEASLECYRDRVESKLLEIFEACAFQDITGQRIEKVVSAGSSRAAPRPLRARRECAGRRRRFRSGRRAAPRPARGPPRARPCRGRRRHRAGGHRQNVRVRISHLGGSRRRPQASADPMWKGCRFRTA